MMSMVENTDLGSSVDRVEAKYLPVIINMLKDMVVMDMVHSLIWVRFVHL